MSGRLADRIAVVTGGGAHTDRVHGIGEETCKRFAEEDASVIVVDHSSEMVDRTLEAIESLGTGSHLGVTADLTDEDELEHLASRIETAYDSLDIVVNNAAIRVTGPVTDASRESWDEIFAVNLRALGEVGRELIPLLAASGGGSIVNISSSNAALARAHKPQYDAMKSGVEGLSRAMACDHAHQGIRVNTVRPGSVVTDYHMQHRDLDDPEAFIEEKTSPRENGPGILKRSAHPREIANGILFLASSEASFITGTCLDVNGGKVQGGYRVKWPSGP